jgi:hypothetical protein
MEQGTKNLINLVMSSSGDEFELLSTTYYDLNAQFLFNSFLGVGVSYRVNSAIVGLVNVTINKKS